MSGDGSVGLLEGPARPAEVVVPAPVTETAAAEASGAPRSKEVEIADAMTPALARILVGSATKNPERFNPGNTDRLEPWEGQKVGALRPEDLDYETAAKASLANRETADDYDVWEQRTKDWVEYYKDEEDDLKDDRIAALKAIGILGDEGAAGAVDIDKFYRKYLEGRSDIRQFVTDIAKGTESIDELKKRLDAIRPLLKSFGETDSVDKMVYDFAIAHGMLSQPPEARQSIPREVGKNIVQEVPDTAEESKYLKALNREAEKLAEEPVVESGVDSLSAISEGMKLVQRDGEGVYTVEWVREVGGRRLVHMRGPDGSTVNKTEEALLAMLSTPGEAWRLPAPEPPKPPEPSKPPPPLPLRSDSATRAEAVSVTPITGEELAARLGLDPAAVKVLETVLDTKNGKPFDFVETAPKYLVSLDGQFPSEVSETEVSLDHAAAKTINAHGREVVHESKRVIRSTEELDTGIGYVKEKHQDRYVCLPERRMFGVFDGLGGKGNGDLAAQLASDYWSDAARFIPDNLSTVQEVENLLQLLAADAHKYIIEEAGKIQYVTKDGETIKSKMGTTMSLGVEWENPTTGERRLVMVSVGDSRIYRLREGKLEQLTVDNPGTDPAVQARIDSVETKADVDKLSLEEQHLFELRHEMENALGTTHLPKITVSSVVREEGDVFLFTSDGVHDNLSPREIAGIMRGPGTPEERVQRLIRAAEERSREAGHIRAKADDITAMEVSPTASGPSRKSPEDPQVDSTGPFADRRGMIEGYRTRIAEGKALLKESGDERELTAQEISYLINGGDLENLALVMPILKLIEGARSKRIDRKDLDALTERMLNIKGSVGLEEARKVPEYIAAQDAINGSKAVFTTIERALIGLSLLGYTEKLLEDARDKFEGGVNGSEDEFVYVVQFVKDETLDKKTNPDQIDVRLMAVKK